MTLHAEVSSVLDSHGWRKDFAAASVWRVEGSSAQVGVRKAAILEAVCRTHRVHVRYDDEPTDIDGAIRVAPDHWVLPVGVSGMAVLDWLHMGNWQLYLHSAPLKVVDLCRSSDAVVAEFVQANGLQVVIDSFHDDVSWVVGVATNAA